MKRLALILFLYITALYLFAENGRECNEYRIYYIGKDYVYDEEEEEVQVLTDIVKVVDTVYVTKLDEFFEANGYHSLQEFADKYLKMKYVADSLNSITEEQLYYNYFLPRDTTSSFSNLFITGEFSLSGKDLNLEWRENAGNTAGNNYANKEVLFKIEGEDRTAYFINNPNLIKKAISGLFTRIRQYNNDHTEKIKGLNLFFPHYNFRDKRAMTQFVKSVRIIMDASQDFKYPDFNLTVILVTKNGESGVDRDFQYCLRQEASEVIFLDENAPIDDSFVKGYLLTKDKEDKIGLFAQIRAHLNIARWYTGSSDIRSGNLVDFSLKNIESYIDIDYPENKWEIYFLVIVLILTIILILILLYFFHAGFSRFANRYLDIFLMLMFMMVLEIAAISILIFQNMCYEDNIGLLEKNPILLISLPAVVVIMVPLLKSLKNKRKVP